MSYLVHEDDAWLVLAGIAEHLSDHTRTLADVLVHDRTRQHLFFLFHEKGREKESVSQDVCRPKSYEATAILEKGTSMLWSTSSGQAPFETPTPFALLPSPHTTKPHSPPPSKQTHVYVLPTLRKVALMLEARARASRVLPVPGGPYNSTPTHKEIAWNREGETGVMLDCRGLVRPPLAGIFR